MSNKKIFINLPVFEFMMNSSVSVHSAKHSKSCRKKENIDQNCECNGHEKNNYS